MEVIVHEKQEGSLCAQHCLNALLQGSYFTAVDLSVIAKELDESERAHMAEAGLQSAEYQRFLESSEMGNKRCAHGTCNSDSRYGPKGKRPRPDMVGVKFIPFCKPSVDEAKWREWVRLCNRKNCDTQPSTNYDDSGFFSIQVIQSAVGVWDLELIPFSSSDEKAVKAKEDPRSQKAYICNFKEHWFTVRRLGYQWFNLNSLLTGPELISDTYLAMFLTQLQQEGYAIFIVKGDLPDCDADQLLKIAPACQPCKPKLISVSENSKCSDGDLNYESRHQFSVEEEELNRAMQESRQMLEQGDQSLKEALAESMQGLDGNLPYLDKDNTDTPASDEIQPSLEEIRTRRLEYFNKIDQKAANKSQSVIQTP